MKIKISYTSSTREEDICVLTKALALIEAIRASVLATGADASINPLQDSTGKVVGRMAAER